ncbi:hypothetical protein JS531_10095 [Bifidobacterium sp. CP2]|uniref:xylulokinase n=1 Tax=Bifidobacterium sp. CP2 TaxID=2809025 RepID=UPI001BDC0D7F|nr:FGGY family carbohydrate kinase [Bifidobacterium sp. CP2]MBT1182287.1 hypothetical protein [Bifidobacterium sp. CP2]
MSVMGIDLSTQSCTVEVRAEDDFRVIGTARSPLPATHPPVSEQRAEDWWSALTQCMRILAGDGADLRDIRAVSVSGQCHGLVALDGAGRVIRPVKLWNDTTGTPQIERLLERFGTEYWITRTGSYPTAAFTIGKLAWLIEHEPDTIRRIRHILLPHDYITWRLTGEYVTDRSEASGTGYFNSETNTYDWQLLRDCFGEELEDLRQLSGLSGLDGTDGLDGLDGPEPHDALQDMLPRVEAPEHVAGLLTAEAAEALGLSAGIPVGVGGGDQHMSAVGLGIVPGDVVLSMGTSGVVFTTWQQPIHDLSGWVNGVADAAGGWLPLVCVLNCTKVTNWMATLLGVSVQELDRMALSGDDARMPVMAAYLDGERSPSLPNAQAALAGIGNEVRREDMARAAFAGVACGMMRGLDALEHCGVELDGTLIMCGGGAHSLTYRQLFADYTGKPALIVDAEEATARGACVQAWHLLHGTESGRGSLRGTARKLRPAVTGETAPRADAPRWADVKERYLRVAGFAAGYAGYGKKGA